MHNGVCSHAEHAQTDGPIRFTAAEGGRQFTELFPIVVDTQRQHVVRT